MKKSRSPQICADISSILRHDNFKLALVIKHDHIISSRRPFASSKQEVDITSVCQTGNASLFYCFGSREIDAEMTLT